MPKRHSGKRYTIKVLRPIFLRTAGVAQARQHFKTLRIYLVARMRSLVSEAEGV